MLDIIQSVRRRRLRRLAVNPPVAPVPPVPALSAAPPVVTVFGSCRTYDPCQRLADAGRAVLNQSNIFGFVHNSGEVLQQFKLVTGERAAPRRLRPYLNIRDQWVDPPVPTTLAEAFALTDVFVVEISSIRQVKFKAMLLQVNRTRELLATDDALLHDWWEPLVRNGRNAFAGSAPDGVTPLQREVIESVTVLEQPVEEIARDAEIIARLLGKPVVFVSHFNTNNDGRPVPQRARIVEALQAAKLPANCAVFDPTALVLEAGIPTALTDLAHYSPAFEPTIADALAAQIEAVRAPAQAVSGAANSIGAYS